MDLDKLDSDLRRQLEEAVALAGRAQADRLLEAQKHMAKSGYDPASIDKRKRAAEKVLADLVRVCQCCSAKSSQRQLVKADTEGTLLCLQCYHELTGKIYEPPKPTPKPTSFGGWS